MHKLKKYLEPIFQDPNARYFWAVNDFLAIVILLSTLLVILETNTSLSIQYERSFKIAEWTITLIFTLEYLIYIFLAQKKRKYLFSFYGVIDLLAILPTYLLLFNLQFLKILRVIRLLRFMRLVRLVKLLELIKKVQSDKKNQEKIMYLNVKIYLASLTIFLILMSTILFYVERNAPGTQMLNYSDAVWTTMAALTTVGFGDVFPVTDVGRLVSGITMVLGVALFSFAIVTIGKLVQGIIFGSEITEEIALSEKETKKSVVETIE